MLCFTVTQSEMQSHATQSEMQSHARGCCIDCFSSLVLLLVQTDRVFRHHLLHPSQEEPPDNGVAYLPPLNHVHPLVDCPQVVCRRRIGHVRCSS